MILPLKVRCLKIRDQLLAPHLMAIPASAIDVQYNAAASVLIGSAPSALNPAPSGWEYSHLLGIPPMFFRSGSKTIVVETSLSQWRVVTMPCPDTPARPEQSASTGAVECEPMHLWLCAYDGQGPPQLKADAQVADKGAQQELHRKLTAEGQRQIKFDPPEKVDGVFTSGEHTVEDGVYIARGKAKVNAEGCAVVYALEESWVPAKDKAIVYASDNASAQANGEATIYARHHADAYGFDKATVYSFDEVEVHLHDQPTAFAYGKSEVYSNDNSTVYAFDNCFVWPRTPTPPDMNRVYAYDNAVVTTNPRIVDGKPAPLPRIKLSGNAIWVEVEPQFSNPVLHRNGNSK
ncbi:MAG TPA: hypothetical protein V6D17_06725 [Candidatus Obscuribacterales bacterium]